MDPNQTFKITFWLYHLPVSKKCMEFYFNLLAFKKELTEKGTMSEDGWISWGYFDFSMAAQELANLGYTSVFDMGGIVDWPYGTVMD